MIGSILGHFRIDAPLGAGGMGEVFLAHDLELDRKVALKFLQPALARDPDARRRFVREAQALAALDHPSVGAVHGVEEADGRVFLVLSFVEGAPLSEVLAKGPLTFERARRILPGIAEGLAAAHARGIVHRDVKPSNVVVGPGDAPKLVDFGIALRGEDTRLTQTGTTAGTPGSTAPEVFRGEPVGPRADVFSLGVLMYESITGRKPFERETAAATMRAVLDDDPPPFPGSLDPRMRTLEPLVRSCLARDPSQRPADSGAVASALRDWAALPDVAPTMPFPHAPRKRSAWLLPAAVIVVVVAGVAFWLARPRSGKGTAPTAAAPDRRAVAVLEFENVSGEPSIDWMKRGAPELLASALVQSPQLDVYDAQRLLDLTGAAPGQAPTGGTSYAFLAKHGITRAVTGTILKSGGDLRIESRLIDTRDGRPIQSYTESGPADSGLIHLVGRILPELQVALEVNLTGDREAEGWLREVTTTSADAYRSYLRGHEALLASHWKEAASAYERALELDSTFVAARTELSGAYWNLGDGKNLELTRAAMRRLRPNASHREQLRIDLQEAIVGYDPPGLIRAATELSALYPENRFYRYLLGRGYFTDKQYRRCIDTLAPLVEQRYGWSWTYVLTARAAEKIGDIATARRAYDLGLEVTHDDPEVAFATVEFLQRQGDFDQGRDVIDRGLRSPSLAESPVAEGELRLFLAKDLAHRGQAAQAREELGRASLLIPLDDETREEADSLLTAWNMPRTRPK